MTWRCVHSISRSGSWVSFGRVRTTVIAAAAVITSLLGAATIDREGVSGWAVVAFIVFAGTGALSLIVLWPRTLRFAFDARRTYEELYPLAASVPEAQLRVAYSARDRYVENKDVIDRLGLRFKARSCSLARKLCSERWLWR
jgi:hypothetical protein